DFAESIVQAEEIRDWLHYATFSDLITFERHLAHLASAVVLFVESPGSIAELGAFSLIPEIAQKLIVFVREDHYYQESYIKLGPLQYIESTLDSERVSVYPWTESQRIRDGQCTTALNENSLRDYTDDIVDDIRRISREANKSTKFNSEDYGHVMLIIADLVSLFTALKEKEVASFVGDLGLHVPPELLNQFLFICEKLGLLVKKKYSGVTYFIETGTASLVKYSLVSETRLRDRITLKQSVLDFYRSSDAKRSRAIAKFRSET
ncbi:MAG: retron St85 family effector protein, partial [Thiohalocapsa sp.]